MEIKRGKWSRVKDKTVNYLKTISIPGIPQIVITESYLSKLLWTVLIVVIFALGFENITYAVVDFYKFDKITNIERVTPENVTFPPITICTYYEYYKIHKFKNGSDVKKGIKIKNDNNSRISNFINFDDSYVDIKSNDYLIGVSDHLDFFKISNFGYTADCFRFNGVTKKNIELIKASSIEDLFHLEIKDKYIEPISKDEYFEYCFAFANFLVHIGNKSLNSFDMLDTYYIRGNFNYAIKIAKETSQIKLPEPYNDCNESSVDKPYNKWNCVESCIFRETGNKYNCTFPLSLFAIRGVEQCDLKRYDYPDFRNEFLAGCLKLCSLVSCYSESFSYTIINYMQLNDSTQFTFVFRDFSTLNITQIPKIDGFTFINNIGGGLGLFMGLALPNLIEFLQFVFEIFSLILFQ